MWKQLGFGVELRIFDKQFQIRLTHVQATPTQSTLPSIPPTARVAEADILLPYRAKDNVGTGDDLAPVTHAVLLRFWGTEIAFVAPSVGRAGYMPYHTKNP